MLFFDIDETIIDHVRAQKLGAAAFLREHRELFPFEENDFVTLWHESAQKYFDLYVRGGLSYEEQRRQRMKNIFKYIGIELSDRQADEKFAWFLHHYEGNWAVFSDVFGCLERWQGKYPLGIISNGNYERQVKKLEKTGVLHYFSVVVTSSQIGTAKPDPRIFIEASRKINKQTNDCFYIGDQLQTDAIGSFQAGMRGIWLNRNQKVEEIPHGIHMIHSLDFIEFCLENSQQL
jgi:putative hydrolase of the HAD superfamily